MIDLEVLESNIQKRKIDRAYIFTGLDEVLIKENIETIVNMTLDDTFKDLNLIKLDGVSVTEESIIDACETLPFMSDKKAVVIFRANFLKEKVDANSTKIFKRCEEYIKNPPPHCVFILYYLLEDKRDNPTKNRKLMALDKSCTVVKANKLKGDKLLRKVNSIFESKGKDIGKIELRYFCDIVENNFNIIEREAEKLICYVGEREITRNDIALMLPQRSEDDVFDLVEYLSQKRPEKSIDLMNELLNKGENMMLILSLIESQFSMLFKIKLGIEQGKNKDQFAKELRRPAFVCEKLMGQSKKFTLKQLEKCMKLCIDTERILKSSGADKQTEMELLLINTVRV